eukprot:3275937-Rhodomonas_salina.1
MDRPPKPLSLQSEQTSTGSNVADSPRSLRPIPADRLRHGNRSGSRGVRGGIRRPGDEVQGASAGTSLCFAMPYADLTCPWWVSVHRRGAQAGDRKLQARGILAPLSATCPTLTLGHAPDREPAEAAGSSTRHAAGRQRDGGAVAGG